MTRSEMIEAVYRRFAIDVSLSGITRAMQSRDITWKIMRRVAIQQRPELRHFYWRLLQLAGVKPFHCIFIDESGVSPPDVFRRKGRAKKGVTPIQKDKFQRENRVQILSAYTLKGIKMFRVFYGSTDTALIEDFVEQLLKHVRPFPDNPESAILWDNASFHFSDKIDTMCENAGVPVFFTAPYTPRTNPIEEHFGILKERISSKHKEHADLRRRSFEQYVKANINSLKDRGDIAEGHFRNAGFYIEPQSVVSH